MNQKQSSVRKRQYFHIFNSNSFLTFGLVGILLAFLLTITWFLPLKAQTPISGLNFYESFENFPPHIPTFREGDLELAPIFIDGKAVGFVASKIGREPNIPDASSRARLIHRKLQGILDRMSNYSKNYRINQNISDTQEIEKAVKQQLNITASMLQETFVVLIAFPHEAPSEVVFSITKADAQRAGLPEEKMASESVRIGRELLLQAWNERQPDYLQSQNKLAFKYFFRIIVISLIILWGQKFFASKSKQLQHLLSTPTNSGSDIENDQPESINTSKPMDLAVDIITARLEKLSNRQQLSINNFFRAILLGGQILWWVIGLGYLFSLFYWSRPLSNWLIGITLWGGLAPLDWLLHLGQGATLGVPLIILLLFVGIGLINKGSYALIDYFLGKWMLKNNNNLSVSSERYQLRGPTLINALKGLVTVVTYFLLGIFILRYLGALPNTVTIILGVISLGISLGAQNLIKDVINGILILWQDWYAIGDWIAIDEFEGSVENLSLQMTQLRNLEGELITIPNGTIHRVRNKSSGWSQVKFSIDISYDADLEKTMTVMKEVAEQIYDDPVWQDKLLDSPKMLGVERLEHTGVNIRILLKTKPLEQWAVAREYRRRLKKAFDESNIPVALPRHLIFVNDSSMGSKQ